MGLLTAALAVGGMGAAGAATAVVGIPVAIGLIGYTGKFWLWILRFACISQVD